MIPTPTELQHFMEVFKTLNMSIAAKQLRLSQPTLSQSLKRLEEKINSKLFIRSQSGLFPTPIGMHFYQQAQSLFLQWNSIHAVVQAEQSLLQGRFRLGCHPSVAAFTLPHLLKNIQKNAPDIHLDLFHDFSKRINEKIIHHELDLGLVMNPYLHPDLVITKLCEDQVQFWVKAGQKTVPTTFIADANEADLREILGTKRHSEFKKWKLLETSNLELIRTLTLQGLGVGLLPSRVAHADQTRINNPALIPHPANLPGWTDELFLVYRKQNLSTAAGKFLLKAIREISL